MKIAPIIITLLVFIVVAVIYFAWVGSQLSTRAYPRDFIWPF